jgi:hypothetical protein
MAILLAFWLMCGVACGVIASNKGRSGVGWFLLGCVLGIFGLIIVACLSKKAMSKRHEDQFIRDGKLRRCPDCAETVQPAARVCKHCGHRFDVEAA